MVQAGPGERRRLLLKAADILQSKVDDFAAAVIAETGSPGHWAQFNVGLAADMIREAASMTTQVTGEVIPPTARLARHGDPPAGRRDPFDRTVECADHPRRPLGGDASCLRQHGGVQGERELPADPRPHRRVLP